MASQKNKQSIKHFCVVVFLIVSLQGCYSYRVLNTVNDPASVQYHHKILWAFCWGLVVNPQTFSVNDCENNGIDEVRISTNLGTNLITVISLGFLSPVKVEWKCHKPCQRVGEM